MTDIRFYHMERQGLDHILPQLLSKALAGGYKVLVKTSDEAEAERLNAHLWSYDPTGFLPHGSQKDGNAAQQPVWLTANDDNPNGANVLILTGGTQSTSYGDFDMCCEMLDGHNQEAVSAARARWKTYKDEGHDVTYWQQGAKGWEKKA